MGPAILIASSHSGDHFHDRAFGHAPPRAQVAFIGAAHGDTPGGFARTAAFLNARYDADVRHARAADADEARRIVGDADLVYLGGGDVRLLMDALRASLLDDAVRQRHAGGAVVLGISAGAIGLGPAWIDFGADDGGARPARFACLGCVPIALDVHDEESDWEELRALLSAWAVDDPGAVVDAYGIPAGGALEVVGDRVTPIGKKPTLLRLDRGRIIE